MLGHSTPKSKGLDLWALMAEAQYQSGQRLLLPPPGLRPPETLDTRNVVLKAIENRKVVDALVSVADPKNTDHLNLNPGCSLKIYAG